MTQITTIIPLIAILVIGTPLAFSQEVLNDDSFSLKAYWCDVQNQTNGAQTDCYLHYQKIHEFMVSENFSVQTEDPAIPKDVDDAVTQKIEELKIEPEPEPVTEAEKLGITEETLEQLEEKRLELYGDPNELIERCLGGEEQSFAFQAKYSKEDLRKRLEVLSDKETLTTADWKLIMECNAIDFLKAKANYELPGLVVEEDTTPKTLSGELIMSVDSFATPEKFKATQKAAEDYIDQHSWLKIIREPNWKEIDDVKTTIQLSPEKQRSNIKTFEHQVLEALEEGQRQACQIAWEHSAAKGEMSIRNWRIMLLDGTCDDHIPNLVEKRGDYKLKTFKGQTKTNCPDCKTIE